MAVVHVPRGRAVSGTSQASQRDEELRNLIKQLASIETRPLTTLKTWVDETGALLTLRHTLLDHEEQTEAQESFCRTKGFEQLLRFICALCNSAAAENVSSSYRDLLNVLEQAVLVVVAALQGHAGNQRYFRTKLSPSGWLVLERTLAAMIKRWSRSFDIALRIEAVFGLLFAAAVGDQAMTDIFARIRTSSLSPDDGPASLTGKAKELMKGTVELHVPEILTMLVKLWSVVDPKDQPPVEALGRSLATCISNLLAGSQQNLVQAHTAGLLTAVMRCLFGTASTRPALTDFMDLGLLLARQGISNLQDAHLVWSSAVRNQRAAQFLLSGLRSSRYPASISFELSDRSHSSLEIAALGKSFPPLDTAGYTLLLWVRFDQFDPTNHTTLFGVFDPSQTCFVLAYLEKDTRHLILQTAIHGSKPSIRFKSTVFEAGRWYHIGIAHRRPRTTSSARASLFVDGVFVEHAKATYPAQPPQSKAAPRIGVQAFYGTPMDLYQGDSPRTCASSWSMASSMLLGDVISDDFVCVIFHLGPGYHGNLQDCLGSFQTYEASALLNLHNENLHPGKEERSEIILAIRQKASQILKENSILINITPTMILDSDDRNSIDESELVKSLSRVAAQNLYQYTRISGNSVAINGAIPAINDALSQIHGIGILTGETAVLVPQSFDESAWRLGGCATLCLNLVAGARSTEDVACAVQILLESVRHNWRNSEIMEREHGYSVLASLLKAKLGFGEGGRELVAVPTPSLSRDALTLQLLKSILAFLGLDFDHPEKSIINNPLAYRILLVDCVVWRAASNEVQELYFSQYAEFCRKSKDYRFNLRRLTRMRVLKRLLEALKSEKITPHTITLYVQAFKLLLPAAASAEMLRSLALFITYAVHWKSSSVQGRRNLQKERPKSLTSGTAALSLDVTTSLSRFDVGVEMLRLYADLLCFGDDGTLIRKFAKTVTNKWLLYLMSETSPEVVVLSTRILSRLLVTHGDLYVKKFREKSGGFTVMRHRLKRWWHIPAIWPACFALLFGVDIAKLDLDRSFDLFGLLELFTSKNDFRVVFPDMIGVVMGMLQTGLKTVAHANVSKSSNYLTADIGQNGTRSPQRLSMSSMAPPDPFSTSISVSQTETFNTVVRFLADLHDRSQAYRDYATSSSYIQELLQALFPVVVGSDGVTAATELNARDDALTFDGQDVIVQPASKPPSIMRTADTDKTSETSRGHGLIRGSSFVLVSADDVRTDPEYSRLRPIISPASRIIQPPRFNDTNTVVQNFLEVLISVFVDQILKRKEFTGLGLFLRTPPGFIEHQAYFESWILRNTLAHLSNTLMMDQKVMQDPKVLTNLAKLFSHLGEALFEGWLVGGTDAVLDLAGSILEYLQRPDVSQTKTVRLCSQAVSTIRNVVFRVVLLSLSQLEPESSLEFLHKLSYWQTVLLSADNHKSRYLELICHLLYTNLVTNIELVREAAADLWRIILVQKPEDTASIFAHATSSAQRQLRGSFEKLVEVDNETFLVWVDDNREQLDSLFSETLSKSWDAFVNEENKRTQETALQRIARRRERLKQWASDDSNNEEIIRRHETTFDHWTSNIHSSEGLKHQRVLQDQQDDRMFTEAILANLQREATRLIGLAPDKPAVKWRLDQTEGRNRMRLRILGDSTKTQDEIQPRRKGSETPALKLDTKALQLSNIEAVGPTPGGITPTESPKTVSHEKEAFPDLEQNGESQTDADADESFELVADPNENDEGFEDKNRKVMRSLHHGDQVKQVSNVSRIIGLEAVEGLFIVGKDYLYMIDNFFQRADGEIVNVWQAPPDERDPYVRMISGRDVAVRKATLRGEEHETRSCKWSDIISVSKRRFLFRDVSLEIFFADGQSYLVTVASPRNRDELFQSIVGRAPQITNSDATGSDFSWRLETLKSVEDIPQTLGSRFANVFNQAPTLAATRRWQKGEMSNFHYLMLVNTLAGRTFNDLTQYPVFPWVIADYTSAELDLTDSKTFRDLSKPMGCQTSEREAEFRERYKSFAEMGDHNSPPFHYGTHYSSAMIVSSYLIRLQPFVMSYLLLQGGSFDHPDRMFFSIARAWNSASRHNMTDVRELTPEFFYLPEFLTNLNGYDFGNRQANNQSIGDVELPPWAHGDPTIFIAKQREALESPFVSQHLHKWIDLIFGYKQKGEAALEAVNVFHHLSYQGARDLENISDPVERLATIGIIHNFGQTPHQVFTKAHPARDGVRIQYKRLDTAAESLTKLPFTLLDSGERVASLSFSWKQERLLCSGPFRLNIPPHYDRYMEWGFVDCSVRFYASESRQLLGLFEHLHIGQLSCAGFVDSSTLITAGVDCTVSIWNVVSTSKSVEIHPRATLFGHLATVTSLAFSHSLSALLSSSSNGQVFMWDLNRAEYVREIKFADCAVAASDDDDEPVAADNPAQVVNCAHINDVTGNVLLCCGSHIYIFSLNGEFILRRDATDNIISCTAYEGAGTEWLERYIVFTGHKHGIVRVWSKTIRDGKFELECIRQLNHVDQAKESGENVEAGISCILPMPQVVYTGDEDGKVVSAFTISLPSLDVTDNAFSGSGTVCNGTEAVDKHVICKKVLDVYRDESIAREEGAGVLESDRKSFRVQMSPELYCLALLACHS